MGNCAPVDNELKTFLRYGTRRVWQFRCIPIWASFFLLDGVNLIACAISTLVNGHSKEVLVSTSWEVFLIQSAMISSCNLVPIE